MLLGLISNLRIALLVIIFIGFIVFGGLLVAVEHRYYSLHFEGKKFGRLVYWLAVILTVAALFFIYRIFYLEMYTPQVAPEATAYV